MPDCWAKSCKSRSTQKRKNKKQLKWEDSHGKRISFHRIPTVPKQRQEWLNIMDLCDATVPQKAHLCSLHFEEKHLDRTSLVCTRLRDGAVPSKNISSPQDVDSSMKCRQFLNENEETVLSEERQDEFSIKELETNIQEDSENLNSVSNKENYSDEQIADISIIVEEGSENSIAGTSAQETDSHRILSTKDQGVNVSPHLMENTPETRFLRTVIQNIRKSYNSKIKSLQQKQRRIMKSATKLKSILEELEKKNLLNTQQLKIFKSCRNFN